MSTVESRIAENLARIRERIDSACRRACRDTKDVRLVAVTKSARLDWIDSLIALGVRDLGESRPQQLLERAAEVRQLQVIGEPIRWHLIGHLQRNKVRKILPVASCLHSVDSLPLTMRIDGLSVELGLRPRVLLEVNVSGEGSKDGFTPSLLAARWPSLCELHNVEIAGLMTMAPFSEDAEDARPTFRRLHELRDRLALVSASPPLRELSMGMSGDFEVAIEEGATLVRVGTSLFEGLPPG
jgi:pyridoxal phosphate enzyme (YggS family)